jgi:uncharacterized protein YoxC
VAPDEISDDVNTVASFIDELSNQIAGANSPEDLLQLAQTLQGDVQELQQASDNVDQYIADSC